MDVSGISITNTSHNLTINGGANDFFIIDVSGTISVTNGEIALSGGITADHVLFNVLGTGNSVSLSNGTSVLNGTFLAPNVDQKITISPGTVNGAIIGYQIQTSSGPTINGNDFNFPASPIPEPTTFVIWGVLGMCCARFCSGRRQLAAN